MERVKKLFVIFGIPLVFFLVSLFTLKDYGISWDEPIHFIRGQAYLHYYLTGELTYKNIKTQKSFFQNNSYNGAYFFQNDSGHPPTNDIMAAFSNFVFFQKLKIMGDIESFHLFNVLASTLLVAVVGIFAYQTMGLIPALIASGVIATYPLFFAESHFNIKDPPQAAFSFLGLWLFWLSLKKLNWKFLIFSGIAFGLSFGMKFNVLFLFPAIFVYLLLRYLPYLVKGKFSFKIIPKKYLLVFLLFPLIILFILLAFWPYLWQDPIYNFWQAVRYYKDIGTGASYEKSFLTIGGFNLYPWVWISLTTPPVVLLLTIFGTLFIFKGKRFEDKVEYLWLFSFLFPILRVSLPKVLIYGGVRQIFEFIPAMALICGYSVYKMGIIFKRKIHNIKKIQFLIFLLIYFSGLLIIVRYHPNENVYFNFLIGGLKGAQQEKIPYWGNSFGNAYWQAVKWINRNTPKGSKLALIQGTSTNISSFLLRSDIHYSNLNWSGIYRQGEYLVELTHNDPIEMYPYVWEYVNKLLVPVYEVKVDGVAIAKVWKNDLEDTKSEYKKPEVKLVNYQMTVNNKGIGVAFNKNVLVTRIFLHYVPDLNCSSYSAIIRSSLNLKDWLTEKESIPVEQVTVLDKSFNMSPFFFAAREIKYLKIETEDKSCLLNNPSLEVWGLN